MKSMFVVDARLSWPLVSTIVFLCASVVLFDLSWRLVTVSFEALAVAGFLFLFVGLAVIAVLARMRGTRRRA